MEQINQFFTTLAGHLLAIKFIRKHEIWRGTLKYGWVVWILVGIAVILGLKFIRIFQKWLAHYQSEEGTNVVREMGFFVTDLASQGYNFFFAGGVKYIMLILLEVIIFHLSRRTLEILLGKNFNITFKMFLGAQIRMLKMVLYCFILEMVFTILIKVVMGFFPLNDILKPIAIFVVQCYFVGVLFLDNYLEQFHLTIKESLKEARNYAGIGIAIGLVFNGIILFPFLGAIIAPVLAAVTVTLMMHQFCKIPWTVKVEKPL